MKTTPTLRVSAAALAASASLALAPTAVAEDATGCVPELSSGTVPVLLPVMFGSALNHPAVDDAVDQAEAALRAALQRIEQQAGVAVPEQAALAPRALVDGSSHAGFLVGGLMAVNVTQDGCGGIDDAHSSLEGSSGSSHATSSTAEGSSAETSSGAPFGSSM